ncbi:sodium-dependent noradrenaline transporter-like protein [Leptotrombidium deliense]|uniref:Transporter n=1 Tax=Leptotrombidium deliense TaxID=299467 RepID=A0A443SK27_9ACAR|nr:sodium-dependent noradrenaline transporter-like protein [Leptotrombidium deliense]
MNSYGEFESYDSLHSTPKQQQHQEKELQSFEVEEMSENKKHESREEMVANKVEEVSETERLVWDKKMDFLLSIIGFAVDLANVWRFPYLCYKNGGGVFLIPYSLMLIFTALPLFFLELSLGQFNKSGPITLWNKVCPTMKGVGSSLPWAHCENPWNTPECLAISSVMDLENKTCLNYTINENRISSAVEFYKRGVLQINEAHGLEDMGSIRWPIVICVACVFVVLYFSLFKGVKSSGKVVWVTATAPYIILTILLIRGLFLPGAVDGIKYYLEPRLEELKKASVWIDAANQVFFSVGVGFGVHLTDALLTVAVNSLTSFYSGFVIFTYLGYMANGMCKKISEVAQEGYGLVFMVYPEAISTLPYSHVWALLFFVMLVTLGLDSAGGGYTMYWFDVYAASVSLLCSALYEAIAISYCYGIDRFCADIKLMINYYPSNYWRICWKFMSPLCLSVSL